MLCFNCGTPLSNSDYCSNCGTKVTVYKKIIKMSNTYYNIGLMKAKTRELSGAVDILRRSLRLNKRNTKARNLLGLVYYEMGETVQALSEWIISTNYRPDKNPANDFLESVRSNPNRLDTLNQTIKKFNIALGYAKQGSEDMAIIQLKKVLNQNPHLVKGHQLLCLLYMKNGEYEKARKTVKKALTIDRCNSISLKYQMEIEEVLKRNAEKKNSEKSIIEKHLNKAKDAITKERPQLSGNDVIIPSHMFKDGSNGAMTIMNIVIGIVIGAFAVFFLITPIRMSNQNEKNSQLALEYNQKLAVANSSTDELQRQIDDLTKEKENLQKKVDEYTKSDANIVNNYDYMLIALKAYYEEDYVAGSEAFNKINKDVTINSEGYAAAYQLLNETLATYVVDGYYAAGEKAYNAGDYATAISNYEKCLEEDATYVKAVYKIAWSYYNSGDTTNSTKYFKKIVNEFPGTEYAAEAESYVGPADATTEETSAADGTGTSNTDGTGNTEGNVE